MTPEADIAGARSAGMRTIWVVNTYYEPPRDADAAVHHLAEIPVIVAAW